MIFKPKLAQQVIEGKKTQTRRVVKPGDKSSTDDKGNVVAVGVFYHANLRLKWVVGRDYAICPGRGKAAIGRIKITEIRREHIMQAGPYWEAEGFSSPSEFVDTWNLINTEPGTRWQDNPEVWAITFELVEATNGRE